MRSADWIRTGWPGSRSTPPPWRQTVAGRAGDSYAAGAAGTAVRPGWGRWASRTWLIRIRPELSPGELRRLAVARALARVDAGATVVLLDEPTAHLDAGLGPPWSEDVIRSLRGRATVIMVAHNPTTLALAEHVVRLGRQEQRVPCRLRCRHGGDRVQRGCPRRSGADPAVPATGLTPGSSPGLLPQPRPPAATPAPPDTAAGPWLPAGVAPAAASASVAAQPRLPDPFRRSRCPLSGRLRLLARSWNRGGPGSCWPSWPAWWRPWPRWP